MEEIEVLVQGAPDKQISLTDPDPRSMATSGKGTGIVGYNVQTAVFRPFVLGRSAAARSAVPVKSVN